MQRSGSHGYLFYSVTGVTVDSFASIDYSKVYVTFVEMFHLDNSGCPSSSRVANLMDYTTMVDMNDRNSTRESNRKKS